MSFSADWLSLRAGFDAAARSTALEAELDRWIARRVAATGRPLAIVDLGAGSGNNRRHLAPRLAAPQAWTLVDADAALLAMARKSEPTVATRQLDLATELDMALPDGTDLVTASALIDLVSEAWLARLVARVRALGAALLVVLTYDGRTTWNPAEPFDSRLLELVNRHQRTDKGFGPALGPDAVPTLIRLVGDRLSVSASDWDIGPDDTTMRTALVDGWAKAASEIAPDAAQAIAGWHDRSLGRRARITVGHVDQLVIPPA